MKHLSEDHYPIKRVMVFLFSPDAKTIEKVGKICYNGISCGADKTKSKEIEVIGFAAFVIAIVVIISLPECQCRFNRIGETAINSERDFRKTQQKIPNKIENSLQMIA